jgi:LCP family protein required for cell wall assembly
VSLAFAALLIIALALGGITAQRIYAFGSAISTQPPFSSQINLDGPDRINLLVMGFGGEDDADGYITDSMLVISLQPQTDQTAFISVPRDLWVQIPPGATTTYGKVDSVYAFGLYNGYDTERAGKVAAGDMAAREVSDITGLSVTYWLTLDFSGFRALVDALGGIDITVPRSFTARYPRNDDPAVDAGWKIVQFDAGSQHMNSEQAIEYARARMVIGGDSTEGSDFARAARQQLLIKAIVSKMTQVSEWPHLWGAMDALQHSLYTNLSLLDLYHLVKKLDLHHTRHIVLSDQNVLMYAPLIGKVVILVPQGGSWDTVKQYIQHQLQGPACGASSTLARRS